MKFDEEKFKKAIKSSSTMAEAMRKLNTNHFETHYQTMWNMIKDMNLDISHWGKSINKRKIGKKKPLTEILVENSTYRGSSSLRRRLINNKILENKCYICGLEKWMEKEISLHLDHINGNSQDNRLENLRILCPNCHSQTPTYCGKNKFSIKIESEKKIYKCECGNEKSRQSKKCNLCHKKSLEKINWPSVEELEKMVKETSYVQVGKKLGVSNTAVKKRIKNHRK